MTSPSLARFAGAVAVAALMAAIAISGMTGVRHAQAADESPAFTPLGQRAETCKSGHTFAMEVTDAELAGSIQGKPADAGMVWLVVIVNVTNTGVEQGDLYMALKVRDG